MGAGPVIFAISVMDNHSNMVGSCDRLDPASGCPSCASCGYRTDPDFTNPAFRLRTRRYDISCCYDGAIIVSARFMDFCRSLGSEQLIFADLPRAPGFHHLKCSNPVALDVRAMDTVRSRWCPGCERYREVIGCSRIVLQQGASVASMELRLSDGYFGSNNEASRLLIAGAGFMESARGAGLTGIDSHGVVD
jgi:hypothetical protein